VHAALQVQDHARPKTPETPTRALSGIPARGWRGEGWLWLAGLLPIISLSLADGVLSNVVAYERDTTVFYFPLMTWVSQQLRSGVFPLWTPQFFGGYPIFADGEIGLAYPPMLLALLSLPADRAFIVLRLLHLCLAGAGMFALARVWRLPYPSAMLAGLVFALGNFLQAQIHHENIVRTASWLPLILACTERALRAELLASRLRWTAYAALALGMAGLALHSQVLAMTLLVLAAYALMRWTLGPLGAARQAGLRWIARFAAVAQVCGPLVALGLGLAAVQLVPLLELATFSARGSGFPYDQAAAYSVTPIGFAARAACSGASGRTGNRTSMWAWRRWRSRLSLCCAYAGEKSPPGASSLLSLCCFRSASTAPSIWITCCGCFRACRDCALQVDSPSSATSPAACSPRMAWRG
jgi:hypothetical protein